MADKIMYQPTKLSKAGVPTTDKEEKAVAKEENGKFYILVDAANKLYDPMGILKPFGVMHSTGPKWRMVTKECFDFYIKYLQTKSSFDLNQARRKSDG